jgi:acetyltransferase-like isoleucine patch superfamily enzyme
MINHGAKIDVCRGKGITRHHCLIMHGCYILSHDGAAHVINPADHGTGFVNIGDHVFIGVNSVVMRNVTIGSQAIIGAGSVVNKDIPEGVVAAGNPIKILKELEKPYRPLPIKHSNVL